MSSGTGTVMRRLHKDLDVFGRPYLVRVAEHGSPVQGCLPIVIHRFDIDAKLLRGEFSLPCFLLWASFLAVPGFV